MKNYKSSTILVTLVVLLIFYLMNSTLVIKNILDYTNLFMKSLFPVSFLFFIFSSLFIDYGLIDILTNYLHLNGGVIYVTLMSLISGFPSGAKYTKELLEKNLISEKTANYLITFTHFPNPLFVLGTVGSILGDSKRTFYLLLSLIMGNFILAMIKKPKEEPVFIEKKQSPKNFASSLSSAVMSAVKVLITIYGTAIFFYLIAVIIIHYVRLPVYPYVLLNGFFDLTMGVFKTSLISNKNLQELFLLCFISLGGFSIHMQVENIIFNTKIKYQNFLLGRIFGTIISIICFQILTFLF